MAGLWIAHIEVKDPDLYAEYVQRSSEIVPSFDGRFLARGGKYRQMEGRDYSRNVVIRFPAYDRAIECYESDEYQEALEKAQAAADRTLVIVEVDD